MLTRFVLALPLLIAPGLLVAASSTIPPATPSVAERLAQATAEARSAEARVRTLEEAASKARGEAARLQARQAAAAEAIAAAEARISAAGARLRLIEGAIAERRERLARQQEPAGALLAGLAMMASRPPMIAILDEGSTRDFVQVRLLLDATLPVIRQRTAGLVAAIERGEDLQRSALAARDALGRERAGLAERQREFAELEQEALRLAEQRGGEALGAGDIALVRNEQAAELAAERGELLSAARIARELNSMPAAPPRPVPPAGNAERLTLRYQLPANARVANGFGSVSDAGIRSRGLTLATSKGARLLVPASGIVRFSGPFRRYDGIVIIDHGGGWMSLVLNVASQHRPGTRVEINSVLGRALGPIGVELSQNGQHVSPALIAGSSAMLSKARKDG